MSAGGLSYSGLRTSSKVTLPSVEMWGTDMNILKDPYKSVHTRRIDKVGDTQSILLAQDESGDRICEMINVYARGVNPMVSVSYDNYSNNAGKGVLSNTAAVSLPYKVENVRPPIFRQEDLLPLSRLPRNWFYSYTNPAFPDLVQAEQCQDGARALHDKVLHHTATTNRGLDLGDDLSVPREAATNAIADTVQNLSTETRRSLPVVSSLRDRPDVNVQRKSIQDDKMAAEARTNLSTIGERAHEHDAIEKGRLHDTAMNVSVHSKPYNFQTEHGEKDFLVKDPKQLNLNRRAYQAFSKPSQNIGSGLHETKKIDTNKFIHKDKYLCVARTNRVKENFIHPVLDASTIHTKDYLYTQAHTQPTSVFQKTIAPDHEKQLPDPLRISATTTLDGFKKNLSHDTLNREYRSNPSQPFDVRSSRSISIHKQLDVEHLDQSRVHGTILNVSVESAKQMNGGEQPTAHSVSSFVPNPRVHAEATSNKTMIGDHVRRDDVSMRHGIQDVLATSAETRKTFIGTSVDPFQDTTISLHNEKRTPLHSVATNPQSSQFAYNLKHDVQKEQHRRVLHSPVSTFGTDENQLSATEDVYHIQNRNAKIAPTLTIGGFEGQGSAIPTFERYNSKQQSSGNDQRNALRLKTQDMFHERFPTPDLSV